MAGGIQSGPLPWWQQSGDMGQSRQNLESSAPSGYTYDPVQMKYVQSVGSAQTKQNLQNTAVSQEGQLFDKLMGAYGGLNGSGTGGSGGGGLPGMVTMGGGNTTGPDASAAQSAMFGQAKAQAGSLGRSAVDSMKGEMADRGLVGSGAEARGLTDQLAKATNPLSDLNTSALHENVGIQQHNQDLDQQRLLTNYQGGIAQRGQDVSYANAQSALAQQKQLALSQMLSNAMRGLTGSINFNSSY